MADDSAFLNYLALPRIIRSYQSGARRPLKEKKRRAKNSALLSPLILRPGKNSAFLRSAPSPRHRHGGIRQSDFDVGENHTGKEIAKAVALADDMFSLARETLESG